MVARARGLGKPSVPSWRAGCQPAASRLMAWRPAGVGAAHLCPSLRVRLFPHAPQQVQRTMGSWPSVRTSVCPEAAYSAAAPAILLPSQRCLRRYWGMVLAVVYALQAVHRHAPAANRQ